MHTYYKQFLYLRNHITISFHVKFSFSTSNIHTHKITLLLQNKMTSKRIPSTCKINIYIGQIRCCLSISLSLTHTHMSYIHMRGTKESRGSPKLLLVSSFRHFQHTSFFPGLLFFLSAQMCVYFLISRNISFHLPFPHEN